jgi:hypothetical protein
MGDRYHLGPLEGKKASQKALGLLSRKATPSWARGELLVQWADARKKRTSAQAAHWIQALSTALIRFSRTAPLDIGTN